MQREINDKVFPGNTVSPFEDAGRSSAIDRTASNYNDAKEKFQKNKRAYQNRTIWRGHREIHSWFVRAQISGYAWRHRY